MRVLDTLDWTVDIGHHYSLPQHFYLNQKILSYLNFRKFCSCIYSPLLCMTLLNICRPFSLTNLLDSLSKRIISPFASKVFIKLVTFSSLFIYKITFMIFSSVFKLDQTQQYCAFSTGFYVFMQLMKLHFE